MNRERQSSNKGIFGGRRHMGVGLVGPKAKAPKKTIRTLGEYLAKYKIKIVIVIIFSFISTIFSIAGPKLLGQVTTKLVEGLVAYKNGLGLLIDFDYMGKKVILLVALYFVAMIAMYIQGYIMSKVSMEVTYNLRRNISKKMNKIPLNYYDTKTHGEILSRITNDVDMVSQTLNQSLTQFLTSITMIVGILVMMISISWLMTLAALIVIPISMSIVMIVVKKSQKFFTEQQKYIGEVNGIVEENYAGHIIVKAFNGEAEAMERFDKVNEKLFSSAWKSQFVSSIMFPIMNMVGNLGYVIVCILGGYLAVKKTVDLGDIQAFIQYTRNFTRPMAQLTSISNTMQSTIAAAERVFEFLEEEEEVKEQDKGKVELVRGSVSFKNVSFGYNPEEMIIKNFSAQIEEGQKIAIVGPTGAGKTTIVKLLMRFYDIQEGEIIVDGKSIFDMTRDSLRSMFGMVLQDTWLYNASILDNIRYGTFDATEEDVIQACKAAYCDDFIRTLPDGYHMVLNEEATNISQGQKQLFTIARVILADPRILILDEATSSVDTRTELLIQKAMDTLMKNRTSFVIAHRLSTIKDADVILVMDKGDIVEQGSHENLLKKEGFYAQLYNSQFGHTS